MTDRNSFTVKIYFKERVDIWAPEIEEGIRYLFRDSYYRGHKKEFEGVEVIRWEIEKDE